MLNSRGFGKEELPVLRQWRICLPRCHRLLTYKHLQGCRGWTQRMDGGCSPQAALLSSRRQGHIRTSSSNLGRVGH